MGPSKNEVGQGQTKPNDLYSLMFECFKKALSYFHLFPPNPNVIYDKVGNLTLTEFSPNNWTKNFTTTVGRTGFWQRSGVC